MRVLVVLPLLVGGGILLAAICINLYADAKAKEDFARASIRAEYVSNRLSSAIREYRQTTGRYPNSLEVLKIHNPFDTDDSLYQLTYTYKARTNGYTLNSDFSRRRAQ